MKSINRWPIQLTWSKAHIFAIKRWPLPMDAPPQLRWFCYLHFHFQALAGLVELPAIGLAMFIITRVGKKWFFCSTFFFAGIACLCITIYEGWFHSQWLKISLLMVGKLSFDANTIYALTSTTITASQTLAHGHTSGVFNWMKCLHRIRCVAPRKRAFNPHKMVLMKLLFASSGGFSMSPNLARCTKLRFMLLCATPIHPACVWWFRCR